MHGNVNEWVQNEWHESYEGAPPDGSAWEDGSGAARVVRSGGWSSQAEYCKSARRATRDPAHSFNNLGFRLVKEI